ncbi:D,D-heptose 1,7-bisphosphate phosphatase [archaeon]|jgi:D,D-heptose 1,7-bisphosphate phosphatase|nr:D,D-heptose 1,7-bisphosphate phosphatase [archaeon]MDP6548072.1 HAD family hydrolase [Candidatus Woesearchaeota archaeon]|tara:strand:- start:1916 stop:2464 length:549 start_codon:yes stop_codon:yes gene_type:complete
MNKAIFLDRDGVLNKDTGYPHKIEDFILSDGVVSGLKKLKDFKFFIISNQSGIGRGYYTEEDFHNFNNHLLDILNKNNIKIERTYFCPHHPNEVCDCRKPNTKFIKEATKEFNIDLTNSWVIGDHPHDVEMGINAGCKAIYLLTGHGKKHFDELKKENIKPNFTAENFLQAAEFIIHNKTNN